MPASRFESGERSGTESVMVKVAIHQSEDSPVSADADQRGQVPPATLTPLADRRSQQSNRRRPLLKMFFFMLVLTGLAPTLITVTGTAGLLLGLASPKIASMIRFQAVQLHWWAPAAVSDLQLDDMSFQSDSERYAVDRPLLAQVRRAASRQPLWQLLLNAGRGLELELVDPRVRLIAGSGATNLEQTLQLLCGPADESGTDAMFPMEVTVSGGVVECFTRGESASEESLQKLAVFEQIDARISTLDTAAALPHVQLTAVVRGQAITGVSRAAAGRTPQRLAADLDDVTKDFPAVSLESMASELSAGGPGEGLLRLTLNPRLDETGRQLLQLGARNLDLNALAPILQLAGIDADVEGRVSGGIDARVAGAAVADGVAARVLLQGESVRFRDGAWASREWLPLGTVHASGSIAMASDGLLLDNLQFDSEVLQVTGRGEIRQAGPAVAAGGSQAELMASLNLPKLVTALQQTLGLADDVAVESGLLRLTVRAESERTQPEADVEGLNARWHLSAASEELRIRRDQTVLDNSAGLQCEAIGEISGGLPALRQARLTAGFGVLDCVPDGAAWKLAGRFEPDLLWKQLRQLIDIPQPGLTAPLTFQCRATPLADGLQLTDVNLTSADLRLSSLAMGVYPTELFPRNLDGELQFRGTASAVKTLIAPWHDAWWLAKSAAVEGSLNARRTAGIEAAIRIRPEARTAAGEPRVRGVSQSNQASQVWSGNLLTEQALSVDEGDLQLSLEAAADGRQYSIRTGQLTMPGLHSKLSGGLRLEEGWINLAVSADTRYDLGILSTRLFDPLSGLRVAGTGSQVFTLSGDPTAIGVPRTDSSVRSPRFAGSGALAWDSAEFQGLVAGPGAMTLELHDDTIRSGPVQCAVNGGEANLLWQYEISRGVLAFAAGSRVENLRLTEDFCRGWLGYVSPLLAGAVNVEGHLSGRVEECVWDIWGPQNSTVRGQLTIHEAAATPSNSMARLLEIVDLLRRRSGEDAAWSARALSLPQQTVPLQLEQGWVRHQNLAMDLAGYRMVSSGAVGLDQQLQLTLTVPLEKQAVGGRSIPVALRGTIAAPQPDVAGFLQAVGGQQLQKQIQGQVDKAVNDQLQKLFGREK